MKTLPDGWPRFEKKDFAYDGRHLTYKPGVWQALKRVFPDIDVEREFKLMERWLAFNSPKKNWTRFVCNWLLKARTTASVPNKPDIEMPVSTAPRKTRSNGGPTSLGDALVEELWEKIERRARGDRDAV